MKQRWEKFISNRLAELDEPLSRAAAEEEEEDMNTTLIGFRPGATYYTPEEDWSIVKFIRDNGRQGQVKGNALWKVSQSANYFLVKRTSLSLIIITYTPTQPPSPPSQSHPTSPGFRFTACDTFSKTFYNRISIYF